MSRTQRDPVAGGRAAASGYRHQYAVAADLTLDGLRSSTFVELKVEDPEAGRLDDVQIVREGRCNAYQVKSSAYSAARTLRALATPKSFAGIASASWSPLDDWAGEGGEPLLPEGSGSQR